MENGGLKGTGRRVVILEAQLIGHSQINILHGIGRTTIELIAGANIGFEYYLI